MKRISFWVATAAFSLMVLGLPSIASAQYRDPNGGYNNGGYYGNGRYGNVDTRQTVKQLKKSAKDFQKSLDRELDRSRYNRTQREDQLNGMAKQFRQSVNRINDRYDQRNINDIRRALDMASQLDRALARHRLGGNVQYSWQSVRYNLDSLAQSYGIYNNNRNDRNGRWGNGNNRGNMPSWWPF
jgi:hypothetical protein